MDCARRSSVQIEAAIQSGASMLAAVVRSEHVLAPSVAVGHMHVESDARD